jgi:Domain of unknown function (DUF4167)
MSMRQGQQHIRRGRGRNNNHGGGNNSNNNNNNSSNNRKNQNPLTRSFESNGPDVKIRGNPMHIAEKYIQLARDAQSAGDPVLAESYLQHAEHYNRIIMAHRDSVASQNPESSASQFQRGRQGYAGEQIDEQDENGDGESGDGQMDTGSGRSNSPRGHEPQPRFGDGGGQPSLDNNYGGTQDHPSSQNRNGRPEPRHDNRNDGRDNRNTDGRPGQQRRPFRDRYNHDQSRGQGGDRQPGDRQYADRFPSDRIQPERQPERQSERISSERSPPDHFPSEPVMPDAAPIAAPEPRAFRAPDRLPPPLPPLAAEAPVVPAERAERREPRAERPRRAERPVAPAAEPGFDAQPDFLRRPVRRPRREAIVDAADTPAAPGMTDGAPPPDKTPLT